MAVFRFLLADIDSLGMGGSEREKFFARQMIEQYDVGLFQHGAALDCDQVRIARTRTNKKDLTHP